jgi:hypothetical protein
VPIHKQWKHASRMWLYHSQGETRVAWQPSLHSGEDWQCNSELRLDAILRAALQLNRSAVVHWTACQ